ncbi:hypothetical protein OSB04_023661 [Centaurea solstitialis]|uniref:Uncharacterized protein n=1 Tax=Centaurea solstitialis TaxID=347529 RepID=A0AA38SLC5_9ASTR|nr:hypothetical protein OSB04_023661 [Centaurea solstitialis]
MWPICRVVFDQSEAHVLLNEIQVEESLSYVESPIAVLRLRNKKSSTEKVQGQHRKESEWIREQEAEMLEKYRDFLQIDFGDEIGVSAGEL